MKTAFKDLKGGDEFKFETPGSGKYMKLTKAVVSYEGPSEMNKTCGGNTKACGEFFKGVNPYTAVNLSNGSLLAVPADAEVIKG